MIEPQSAWNVRVGRHILEVWSWTYYSAEANTQIGRRMHQIHTLRPRNEKNSGEAALPKLAGATLPSPHTSYYRLRRLYSCTFGARLLEINPSPGSASVQHTNHKLVDRLRTSLSWHLQCMSNGQ